MRRSLTRFLVAVVACAPLAGGCGTKIVDLSLDAGPTAAPARGGPAISAPLPSMDASSTPLFPRPVCLDDQTDAGSCKSCWDEWGRPMGTTCKPTGCRVMPNAEGQRCLYCAESGFKQSVGCVKCMPAPPGQPCQMCQWTDLASSACKQCYRQDGALEFDGCVEIRPELKQ